MIAEGNEPGGGSSGPGEGRTDLRSAGRSEGDLLAERRARRAAESGEHALTLRAEAAEATVRTLETHVTSLQQRLQEAEQDRVRVSELIDAEQAARGGHRADVGQRAPVAASEQLLERELRRASQREYAEQQLRAEAEERCAELERDARAEVERLSRRLSASERDARASAERLEILQRELAEAEQSAASERAAVLRSERAMQARLAELERRASEIQGGLEAERAARQRTERLLEAMRRSHRNAERLVAEVRGLLARVKGAAGMPASAAAVAELSLTRRGQPPLGDDVRLSPPEASLRERPPTLRERPATLRQPPLAASGDPEEARSEEMAEALAAAVARLRARVEEHHEQPAESLAQSPSHKHSMSAIARWRIALGQRRERRKQRHEA